MYEDYVQGIPWALRFFELFAVLYDARRFHSNFGVSIYVCANLWRIVLQSQVSTHPDHLLYFLSFAKSYDTFDNLSTKFHVTEKTFRTNTWKVVNILYKGLDTV